MDGVKERRLIETRKAALGGFVEITVMYAKIAEFETELDLIFCVLSISQSYRAMQEQTRTKTRQKPELTTEMYKNCTVFSQSQQNITDFSPISIKKT